MKKQQIINQVRKDSTATPTPESSTPTRLSVGDVVMHNGAEHFVARVNDCRASLYPVASPCGESEGISPDSELPIVRSLGVKGLLALLESEITTTARKSRTAKDKSDEAPKLGALGGYLGFSVVSVIRALGAAGWVFADTRAAFDREGVLAKDQTLRIQLKCGRDGNGAQAELTAKQIAQLKGKKVKAVSKAEKAPKAPKAPKAAAAVVEVDADGTPVATVA